jgi:hypothetical protein
MRFICLCVFAWLYAAPSLALESDRIFDIVPAEGQTVEMVDGATVLRQVGQSFGVVLSFRPDSPTQGWIFAAVLNVGKERLRVGSSGFSAASGDNVLRIASTTELIALVRPPPRPNLSTFTDGSPSNFVSSASRSRAAQMFGPGGSPTLIGDVRRRDEVLMQDDPMAPISTNQQTPARTSAGLSPVPKEKAKEFIAMLFPNALLAPGRIVKGELLLDLPARQADEPASFVLRVSFGDESMEVTYREREG